eukprot:Gb_36532 [translate_table: standard]
MEEGAAHHHENNGIEGGRNRLHVHVHALFFIFGLCSIVVEKKTWLIPARSKNKVQVLSQLNSMSISLVVDFLLLDGGRGGDYRKQWEKVLLKSLKLQDCAYAACLDSNQP